MARQMKYLRLILTGALVFAAWLPGCSHTMASAPGGAPGWGQEQLTVSERAYSVDRVNRILDAWGRITRQAQRRNPAPVDGPPYTCLVVDTGTKELWVESDGRILAEYHSDLPAGMDWSLYQVTRGESTRLPPVSRFRLPGGSARSDQALLLGQNKAMCIYFSFGAGGSGSGYGGVGASDVVRGSTYVSPLGKTTVENTPESLMVSPDNYEKAKASFGSKAIPVEPVVLTENKAGWLRVERLLYQEIESQMSRHRCQLSDLKIDCGPDYTAATAQVQGTRKGGVPLPSRRQRSIRMELRIDSLGRDVWYAKSTPTTPRSAPLDLEFLVCAAGSIPEPNRAALLQEGRSRQQETLAPPASSWRIQLANGATVELVGICENPSAGRQWWGPDGSLLGYAPCSTRERLNLPKDRAAYDIAWRVDPPQEEGLQISPAPEGFCGAYRGQTQDRYGREVDVGLVIGGYVFDRSQEKATLEFIVRNARGEPAPVAFENISLVCEKEQGFAIKATK